ncbi:MAG: peptidylprolyl isomerase [Verrucomicrobiota bacterium]|jgi:parvulin-like peptidyl-prolyl isomerase
MRRFSVIAGGISLLFCGAARADLVSGIQVVVNDAVITYAEIQDGVLSRAQTLASLYARDPARAEQEGRKLHDEEVERLVEDKLIVHEFQSAGYATNVLESVIDDRIRDKIQKEYYGDRTRLIKTLQAEGITYEMFRRREWEKFVIEYMNYQNSSNPRKILISPLKIEQYYEQHRSDFKIDDQVRLRMIVVNQPSTGPAGMARRLAEEILAKIDAGVPFSEMAAVYSAGSQRSEGGDRGWVDRGYFKPELARVAFSLKPGQHSGVIELPEACYLMMVQDTRPSHIRPMTEVRAEIERTLKAEENLALRKQWIDRLKRKSFVQYY